MVAGDVLFESSHSIASCHQMIFDLLLGAIDHIQYEPAAK
jgi:hypothetical protein